MGGSRHLKLKQFNEYNLRSTAINVSFLPLVSSKSSRSGAQRTVPMCPDVGPVAESRGSDGRLL